MGAKISRIITISRISVAILLALIAAQRPVFSSFLTKQDLSGSYGDDAKHIRGPTETNDHECIPRCAIDGAYSPGDFSRWCIVTLIELIALIFLIGPSLRFGLHGGHVSIAQPRSGCQDQSNHCDQSDQCSHTFGANSAA